MRCKVQSRKHSFIESCLNVASGMVIAFVISQLAHVFEAEIQKYIWTGFTWNVSAGSNAVMTVILTVVSISRGYAWRRHFNKKVLEEYRETN